MDIKLKELEKKNKTEQENLKRTVETTVPNNTTHLALVFEIQLAELRLDDLPKKTIDHSITIFHPPQFA